MVKLAVFCDWARSLATNELYKYFPAGLLLKELLSYEPLTAVSSQANAVLALADGGTTFPTCLTGSTDWDVSGPASATAKTVSLQFALAAV